MAARRTRRSAPRRSSRAAPAPSNGIGGGTWILLIALFVGGPAWYFRSELREFLSTHAPAPKPPSPPATQTVARPPAPPTQRARPEPQPPRPIPTPAPVVFTPPTPPPTPVPVPTAVASTIPSTHYPRPAQDLLEAQIALARRLISSGSIDGRLGAQSTAALQAFQEAEGLPLTGRADPATLSRLVLAEPALTEYTLNEADIAGLLPVPPTWLEKSSTPALAHETLLERLAERTHAHPGLLERLNPGLAWATLRPGATFTGPGLPERLPLPSAKAAHLHVRLAARALQARASDGTLIAHFPVSIARQVDKRPVGELRVVAVVPDPNYTFNPAVFPESAEAKTIGRKLILPPGPNNPVGVAWIGLDRAGYGIHGTPLPEQVGRTESHGCFRLANWDARTLLSLARVGLPVIVEP